MPKEPKRKMSAKTGQSARHAPLGQVIQDDANRDKYASMKKLARNIKDDEETTEELLDVKSSKRILELSREQMREVEEERVTRQQRQSGKRNDVSRDSSDEEDSMNDNDEDDEDNYLVQHDEGYISMSNTGLTPEEEALLSNMMGGTEDEPQRKTLADIIMEKIEEKEAMAGMEDEGEDVGGVELPVKVIQVGLFTVFCTETAGVNFFDW